MTDSTKPDKQLAKDVAIQLDKRRRNRRLVTLLVLAAAVAAAIMFVTCGKGWGIGGGGGTGTAKGSGSAVTPTADAGPQRCTVRVAADGIFVDGTKLTRDEAVARCKTTEGALVTVTGDARQGDWDELRAALEAVGVKIFLRGQVGD